MPKAKLLTDVNNPYFSKNKLSKASSQPTSGTYNMGDIVFAENPTASCYGWICTTSGTPGSWMVLKSASDWGSITGKPSTYSPVIGTSSTTAFRGDHGQVAYNHSQAAHAPANAQRNADITKAEIEAKLTGLVNTHTHHNLTVFDGRNSVRPPKDYKIGHEVSFRNREETNMPPGNGSYTTIHTIKGWHDKSGGNATQISYNYDGGTLPQLAARIGLMDGDDWGPWEKIYTSAETSVNVRPVGDHGFGTTDKAAGFIGAYPGWDKNTLYINTYSKEGNMAMSYTNVEVNSSVTRLNSDLRVKHSSYLPNIRQVDNIVFNANFGDNNISAGNGDGADYDKHNLIIRSWWGIGFRNNNNVCSLFMDTRTGDFRAKGIIASDNVMRIRGKVITIQWDDPGDIGEGGIWIRS